MITKVARAAAWLLVLAAIVLTLGPQKVRPYTGNNHDLEHGLAFALVGLAFGLGYPNHRIMLAVLAVAAAGLMEFLQQWVPGGTPMSATSWSTDWAPAPGSRRRPCWIGSGDDRKRLGSRVRRPFD